MTNEARHEARPISRSFAVEQEPQGLNMSVRRSIGSSRARALPPFVGCEEFAVDTTGNPPHPARGFQKITLLLRGRLKVEYSPENTFELAPMDVLSVMVGRGVRPKLSSMQGTSSGLHIWVDVPEDYKRKPPSTEFTTAKAGVVFEACDGARVSLLSGSAFGRTAKPVTLTPVVLMHVELDGKFVYSIPDHWNAFVYIICGKAVVNGEEKVGAQHYVEFAGDCKKKAELEATLQGKCSFIFGTAEALNQPIYHQGPFVDVSSDWINQAYSDYTQHTNGFERGQLWNDHGE